MKVRHYILFLLAAASVSSCSVTRSIPDGKYMLYDSEVEVEKNRQISRSERVDNEDLAVYVKQKPNKRFLGVGLSVGVYSMANPDKDKGMNKLLKRIGSAPVILDSALIQAGADGMSSYLTSRGFREADVRYDIEFRKKKAEVTYNVKPNMPYRIGNVRYDFKDRFLEAIVSEDSVNTLLHKGELYDTEVLNRERQRITSYLKRLGYYNFSVNNIRYVADTTGGNRTADLTVVVNQRIAGYDDNNNPILENNSIYRIRDIYVQTNYDPAQAMVDPDYNKGLDTLEYRGMNFIYRDKVNVKPEVLLRAINIYPNYLYSDVDVKKASDNILRLNYFRNVNILFSEVTDTTTDNMVTFIGEGGYEEAVNYTQEGYLTCNIVCTPGDKHSYSVDGEAMSTSSYYGVLLRMGYQNRNIFRGAELFDVSITGGYEFMRDKTRTNSVELGGSVGITIPKFITPFNIDRYNRLNHIRTRVEFSLNSQNRPYYERLLMSGAFGYTWSNSRYSSYTFRPLDLTIIKLDNVDTAFLNTIENPYLKRSYTETQFILGMSGSYLFNNQARGADRNTLRIRVNAETGGNLLNLISRMAFKTPADGYYKIFGIQYTQYVRADIDASYKFVLGRNTSLVYRLYAGSVIPYGNSTSVPFERLFYAGGPNSMRGWVSRTLGPGNEAPKDGNYPTQMADLKLETNIELRFPLYGMINGAVFADVGNIWETGKGSTDASKFKADSFYKQLGFAGGLGLRVDVGFFLFRADWGVRLHDPNKPEGDRWMSKFTFGQSSLNFGIGYPF